MCELVKKLDEIAEQLITQEHKHISKTMSDEEKIRFVNNSLTIQTHSEFIQNTMTLTS